MSQKIGDFEFSWMSLGEIESDSQNCLDLRMRCRTSASVPIFKSLHAVVDELRL